MSAIEKATEEKRISDDVLELVLDYLLQQAKLFFQSCQEQDFVKGIDDRLLLETLARCMINDLQRALKMVNDPAADLERLIDCFIWIEPEEPVDNAAGAR